MCFITVTIVDKFVQQVYFLFHVQSWGWVYDLFEDFSTDLFEDFSTDLFEDSGTVSAGTVLVREVAGDDVSLRAVPHVTPVRTLITHLKQRRGEMWKVGSKNRKWC